MSDWFERYAGALQERAGGDGNWDIPGEATSSLLHLAKVVADGTGDRRNAPLSTFLAGVFLGRAAAAGTAAGPALAEAVEVAEAVLASGD